MAFSTTWGRARSGLWGAPGPDTDDDGPLDGFEVLYGFDPLVGGEQGGDGNGLDNLVEQAASTSPIDPDSDDDTFGDGAEVAAGTDPNDRFDFPGVAQVRAPGAWSLRLLAAVLAIVGTAGIGVGPIRRTRRMENGLEWAGTALGARKVPPGAVRGQPDGMGCPARLPSDLLGGPEKDVQVGPQLRAAHSRKASDASMRSVENLRSAGANARSSGAGIT